MNDNPGLWVALFCCIGPALIFSAGAFSTLLVQRFRRRFVFVDRRALTDIGYAGSGDGELAAQLRYQQGAVHRQLDAPTTWKGKKYRAETPPTTAAARASTTTTRRPAPPPSSAAQRERMLRGGRPQPETSGGDAYAAGDGLGPNGTGDGVF